MKPLGMDVLMNVQRPTLTEDAVWNAVQLAIADGWDVARFRREASEAWQHELNENAKQAAKDFE